jgi:predicted nuclease of predicted toxin-antitoxin system
MRFLVDAQLPPALAARLRELGHDAEHVFDRFPPDTSNGILWQYAVESGAIIVSKDQDFSIRAITARQRAAVVWLRMGNTRSRVLIERIEGLLPKIESAIANGESLIEVA